MVTPAALVMAPPARLIGLLPKNSAGLTQPSRNFWNGATLSPTLQPPDGTLKLSNCTLQEALDSAYATFASCFGGLGYPPSKKFFEEDIPAMVFDLAVGAGWLPITEAALTPDEEVLEGIKCQDPAYKGRKLVLFGDLMIDVWYKLAFMALLEDSIEFCSY